MRPLRGLDVGLVANRGDPLLIVRRSTRMGAVVCSVAISVLASAVEPDGFTALRWTWADAPPRAGSVSTLVVTVHALVPLEDVAVRIEAPDGAAVAVEPAQAPAGRTAQSVVGDMAAGAETTLRVSVRAPGTGGGVLAFRAEGRIAGGTGFVEGFGVAVGRPGAIPVRRHGALEFSAARGVRTP